MADQDDRSIIPRPTEPAFSWRGEPMSSKRLVDLWVTESRATEQRTKAIEKCRDFRRRTLVAGLSDTWAKTYPEITSWCRTLMSERATIEREIIARAGSSEPVFACESLGFLATDKRLAEEKEAYLNEWRQTPGGVPFTAAIGKAVEDGEFGAVMLPSDLDMEGDTEFFERLSERAYRQLEEHEQAQYAEDRGHKKRPYVKVDADGARVARATWDRDANGRTRAQVTVRGAPFTRDQQKSEQAHEQAVTRYLLDKPASSLRLIPALDCVPLYRRGTGRERFGLAGIIERSKLRREEALEANFGWVGMGTRRLAPSGHVSGRTSGNDDCWYLYTLYTTSKDDEGHERPLIFYCLGGMGTWFGSEQTESGAKASVAVIDLYKEYGLVGPYWWYGGGMTTEDDDPGNYRYQPYILPQVDQIIGLEGQTTAQKAMVGLNAYTGYVAKPDAALLQADSSLAEAIIEQGPNGRQLRSAVIPAPGQIARNIDDIVPFVQARIGDDSWRLRSAEYGELKEATALDRLDSGASGNALLVSETIAQTAKRQLRDCALSLTTWAGETHLKVLYAIYCTRGIKWPVATVAERAIGPGETQRSHVVAEFDPDWLSPNVNYRVTAAYPSEENLARIDLERSLAKDGFGSFEDVQEARGKSDAMAERLKVDLDALWNMPEARAMRLEGVARLRGHTRLLKVLALQQQQQMSQTGLPQVPGLAQGVPTGLLARPEQGVGSTASITADAGAPESAGSTTAQQARAGIQGGQIAADRAAAAASSALVA